MAGFVVLEPEIMALRAGKKLEAIITVWLTFLVRHAWLFILAFLLTTSLLVGYIKNNLGINTDTADMLSETLGWRQDYIHLQHLFPQTSDSLAIVIDGQTPDQVQDASVAILHLLNQQSDQFKNIYQIENSEFFRQNSLLYLNEKELAELTTELANIQPFLARLQADLNLRGLFSILTDAIEQTDQAIDLDRIFTGISTSLSAQLNGQRATLSWQDLMSQNEAKKVSKRDDLRTVITLQPQLDFSKLLPGETAILQLRSILEQAEIEENYQVSVRFTDFVALAYEELGSVTRGAELGGLLALITVAVILIVGLKSFSLVFATLSALIIGLIWTAAFATFAIGELNMISVAFMVLYIGLGVDFAIHYCLRFRERIVEDGKNNALIESGRHVGSSLVICAITTAIGFFAFLPTAYAGVAELGLISGTGMFISLFISLSLLPALIRVLPIRQPKRKHGVASEKAWHHLPIVYARPILLIAASSGLLSILFLPQLRFDHNPVHLMDPSTESVKTYEDLLANSARSPLSISVLTEKPEQISAQLLAQPDVEEVIGLYSFIPTDQDAKLPLIEDLGLIMSLDEDTQPNEIDFSDQQEAIKKLIHTLENNPTSEAGTALLQLLKRWRESVSSQTAVANLYQELERDLLSTLPGRLDRLITSLDAEKVTLQTLPQELTQRWVAQDKGSTIYHLQVFPVNDLDDNTALEAFVAQTRQVSPNATGTPIINIEASRAVIKAFQIAFGLALTVITFLLFFLLDRKLDVIFAILPLILAGLLTTAIMVIFNMPFNFANIIAMPLLLGIGVDSAIHMIHRYRTDIAENTNGNTNSILNTSTARAVLISALTTMCSFGNLAISPHQGTASMGVLLTIGLTLTIITTLFVLPSLLSFFDQRQTQTGN